MSGINDKTFTSPLAVVAYVDRTSVDTTKVLIDTYIHDLPPQLVKILSEIRRQLDNPHAGTFS